MAVQNHAAMVGEVEYVNGVAKCECFGKIAYALLLGSWKQCYEPALRDTDYFPHVEILAVLLPHPSPSEREPSKKSYSNYLELLRLEKAFTTTWPNPPPAASVTNRGTGRSEWLKVVEVLKNKTKHKNTTKVVNA